MMSGRPTTSARAPGGTTASLGGMSFDWIVFPWSALPLVEAAETAEATR